MSRGAKSCENCLYKANCKERGKDQCKYWRSEWDQKFDPYFAEEFKAAWDDIRFRLNKNAKRGEEHESKETDENQNE